MKSTPLAPEIGAEVAGLDLSRGLSSDEAAELRSLWTRHGVLRFRDQTLSDAQLMAFSANFGELDQAPMGLATEAQRAQLENPFVTIISNIVEDGRKVGGLGADEALWHTDMAYTEAPAAGSVLYAVEVPEHGGDTSFTCMHGAYDALPHPLERRIAGLTLKHDASHTSVGGLRPGYGRTADPHEAPGAVHPLVVVHPENHRRTLLLGRRRLAYIAGLTLEENEALLDELWSYVGAERCTWTQRWRVGDLLMWDNRSVMHHRDAFDPGSRRLMLRNQLEGSKPIPAGR